MAEQYDVIIVGGGHNGLVAAGYLAKGGLSVLVLSTDYPHHASAYPHGVDTFLGMKCLSNDSRKKILWDNCARLYGL
ncbi:MAG: FAD-dependent oxidoreductase [Dehalococcoidia bacterium]